MNRRPIHLVRHRIWHRVGACAALALMLSAGSVASVHAQTTPPRVPPAPRAAAPAPAEPPAAPPPRLDDSRFVQGLRERGMREVLIHFLEKNPPKDPILRLEILVEQQKLRAEDSQLLEKDRAQAMVDVLQAYRNLIAGVNRDHEKQPLWKVDAAEYLLRVLLPGRFVNAGEFVEFGVATPEQREAFDKFILEAYPSLDEANGQMFFLIGSLPNRKNFAVLWENNGFFQSLREDYFELRLPFYKSWITYYASLATKPPANIKDGLAGAAIDLRALIARDKLSKLYTAQAQSLLARILIRQAQLDVAPAKGAPGPAGAATLRGAAGPRTVPVADQPTGKGKGGKGKDEPKADTSKPAPGGQQKGGVNKAAAPEPAATQPPSATTIDPAKLEEAQRILDAVASSPDAYLVDTLTAKLAKSVSLEVHGQKDAAIKLVKELTDDPTLIAAPQLLILVYDRWFRLAGDDTAVYDKLFAEPKLGNRREAVVRYVKDRWPRINDTASDVNKAQPTVVLTNIDVLLQEAAKKSAAARVATSADAKNALLAEAGELLTKTITISQELLKRPNLLPKDACRAQFKIGMAQLTQGKKFDAATTWAEVADKYPDQPEGKDAAIFAFLVAQDIYKSAASSKKAAELFEKSLAVLLTKYPTEKLRDGTPVNHLYFTRAGLYMDMNRPREAVADYEKVEKEHPFHLEAIYNKSVALRNDWFATSGESKHKLATEGVAAAEKAMVEYKGQPEKAAPPERAKKLMHNEGDLLLLCAELYAEGLNRAGKAKPLLEGFEQKYGTQPDLMMRKRRLMVNILVLSGDVKPAAEEIKKFAAESPSEAGGLAKGVLESINHQADDAENGGNKEAALSLRNTGVDLAKLLLDWAKSQSEITASAEKLLSFETIYGDQLIFAQRLEEADKYYGELFNRQFGQKADGTPKTGNDYIEILHGRGWVLLEQGKNAQGIPLLNRLVNNIPKKTGDVYWHSWVLLLKARDADVALAAKNPKPAESPEKIRGQIYRYIQQLKVYDANLGGPRWQPLFSALERKSQVQSK